MVNQLAIIVPLLLAATLSAQQYTEHAGLNCYKGHGGRNIDSGPAKLSLTVSECEKRCDATPDCYCVVMTANATSSRAGSCWRRSMCQPAACSSDSLFNAFIKPGAPTPPPTPPTPAPGRPYPDRRPPGPACGSACPNIFFSITNDQDLLLGGWEPMRQTHAAISSRGATMTQVGDYLQIQIHITHAAIFSICSGAFTRPSAAPRALSLSLHATTITSRATSRYLSRHRSCTLALPTSTAAGM